MQFPLPLPIQRIKAYDPSPMIRDHIHGSMIMILLRDVINIQCLSELIQP